MPRSFLALLLVAACSSGKDDAAETATNDDSATTAPRVDPVPPGVGDLLIEELYYSGAAPAGGTDHYYDDQFVELANPTALPLDLSGVLLANVWGVAGAINGNPPDSYRDSRPDDVVLDSVWRIPEGVELPPGGTLVIAHDGTNHRPFSTIDLSGAALETWVRGNRGRDTDHPTVDNLERVVFNGGYDWLITVFGPSVVLLAADTELGTQAGPYGLELPTAPTSAVLDGVDAVMDGDSGDYKRLPDAVDAGFAFVDGTYVGQSIRRKRTDDGWQDTNDSRADFEIADPDPGQPLSSEGVWGDPWIELGTGVVAFEPLPDGSDIELVAGPQGGWHLDLALRFDGFGPGGLVLRYEAVATDATPVSFVTTAAVQEASVLQEDDGFLRLGDRVVLDIANADEVVGLEVIVRVTAELDGQTWSDERRVTVVDNE